MANPMSAIQALKSKENRDELDEAVLKLWYTAEPQNIFQINLSCDAAEKLALLRSRIAELEAGLAKCERQLNYKIAYIAGVEWATEDVAQAHADTITKEYRDLLKVQS